MATFPTFDYEVEQKDLERKQKLVDALMSGALSPMENPQSGGPVTSRISPLAALAKVFAGYQAGRQNEALKEEKRTFSDRYRQDLASGVDDYMRKSQGYDAPEYPGEGAPMRHVPGDEKAAIMSALASNNPVLQALGMERLKEMGKGALTAKDLSAMATPESVLANPGSPASWKAKRELKSAAPGEVLYDSAGNVAELGQAPGGGQGWGVTSIGGDLYQQTSTGLKKLDNATKVSVNASPVIMGQRAGMEAFWKNAAAQVDALGKAASSAKASLPRISKLEELNNSGVFSNVTSSPAVFLSNLGQAAGVKVDTSKLQNSEQFNAEATKLWVEMIKDSGGARGWTEPETKKIEKVLPNLNHSPAARAELIQMMKQKAAQDITAYQSANKSFANAVQKDDPTAFSTDFENIYVPPTIPSSTAPKTIKWGDL